MATSICSECNSENNEVVDGSRCYKCGSTSFVSEPNSMDAQAIKETSEHLLEEPTETEDDIFCSKCDSQPHGVVIAIVKGDMDGLNFREHDRKYVCGECYEQTTTALEDMTEILGDFQ